MIHNLTITGTVTYVLNDISITFFIVYNQEMDFSNFDSIEIEDVSIKSDELSNIEVKDDALVYNGKEYNARDLFDILDSLISYDINAYDLLNADKFEADISFKEVLKQLQTLQK